MTGLSDSFQRPINYLRISVTDRCNLRCIYCMPAEGVRLMSHRDILTYEEIYTLARVAAELGINKVRLTGGEPLVRSGLTELIQMLAQIEAIDDISLTTNGTLLSRYAAELKQAGLQRVNISLDTLKPNKFKFITRHSLNLGDVLEGIKVARSVGLNPVKLNMVVMSGINDDELLDFAAKTIDEEWHVRFIEFMPVGGVSTTASYFVSVSDIRKRLELLGELEPCLPSVGNGPAKYFRFPHARGTVGFITPVSEHFCFHCNRLRLTADGRLRPCLLAEDEIDLKQPLRSRISSAGLKQLIEAAVANKPLRHWLAEGYVPKHRPFSQVGG
ncbi:MAG: GTP 3',8-cyclase MoaA [Dehalococcoidia bacterium]|nr:MAG: GTP 3',8-cyclase MoaA [Dehalococcoidia bacterium]